MSEWRILSEAAATSPEAWEEDPVLSVEQSFTFESSTLSIVLSSIGVVLFGGVGVAGVIRLLSTGPEDSEDLFGAILVLVVGFGMGLVMLMRIIKVRHRYSWYEFKGDGKKKSLISERYSIPGGPEQAEELAALLATERVDLFPYWRSSRSRDGVCIGLHNYGARHSVYATIWMHDGDQISALPLLRLNESAITQWVSQQIAPRSL